MNNFTLINVTVLCLALLNACSSNPVKVSGELKTWHKITLEVNGPSSNEEDLNNPFLNYKVSGIFYNGSEKYTVPGYFAADGNAANTGATAGNIWRIHFSPPSEGLWTYTIRFREGKEVAINEAIDAGKAVLPLDNSSGSFFINPSDKKAPDFRAKGHLNYVGERYLQFEGSHEYFLKAGPDSPENLLAYEDIDNTPNISGLRKNWSAHVKDWTKNDPTWKNGKGKGLIGAMNYLSGKGANTISFLTMNIIGDDKNVYPFINDSVYTRFDCSKLDQWEILFDHAQSKGLHLHFKMQEVENECLFDNGALGVERKLYYRELLARFGHHLALNWNLGEESGCTFGEDVVKQTHEERIAASRYFEKNDPYHHNLVIHTGGSIEEHDRIYTPLLGNNSAVTGASMQMHYTGAYNETRKWIELSTKAGRKWIVANDEQGGPEEGVPPDSWEGTQNKHDIRKCTLWGNLMAGGAGVEYYFGYKHEHSDLKCEDFRSRDKSWEYCKHALDFFNTYLPFHEMENMEGILSLQDTYVLGKPGEIYAAYLKSGGDCSIDLPAGNYTISWYNPRTGGPLINGAVKKIEGGEKVFLGATPSNEDWAVLIRAKDFQYRK